MARAKLFGSSIKRREDPRLITGKGVFTDDVKLPGQVYAVFVRSPHAHARLRRMDVSKAKQVPGVVAAFTGKELADGGVGPLPCGWLLPDLKIPEYRGVATTKADFVGQAVAVVIGETPYAARDGADAVTVDYEVLPSVTDGEKAVAPGAVQIHANAPGNVAFRWSIGDKDKTDAAIKSAPRVVKQRLINQRLIPSAIEPRASLATHNAGTGDLTLWVTSQNPHVHRLLMGAFVLGIPEHKLRVISPDVGGGFGSKIFLYPEEVVVS
ncbi:MAG TPA: molybdopterin cofactor-binding domain-containing protein, partial [Methylomirabilota bacterium]|nr:molybdopterin cofactor-binding domain-containing protein [Methylomirabilota bacterium]